MTISASGALQAALFAHLEADDFLAARFRPVAGGDAELPQFSLDALETEAVDTGLGLARHTMRFSVWAALHAPADAASLEERLTDAMARPFVLNGHRFIRLELRESAGAPDPTTRLWRIRMVFDALTQGE